ncbi:hypothetical protein [Dictyobacter aurantiacus]|uniref:Exonuclease domain-containing protein n=1 Tax=Dictyobacter aurantiacus TaxID=1936993 RepID=A0A401ZJR2_9CHLR|nr:hypothetical protein [Dictyobacter aurantiacus]GCE07064.1 hypothetical protein KDAU_43930 [Dictyobacter aurantiacus]
MTTQYVTPISEAFPLWCQSLLQRSDWVILDTETLEFAGRSSEAIAIAVLDSQGRTLYDRLFNPFVLRARDLSVVDPYERTIFTARWNELEDVLYGRLIISYGAVYNSQVLVRTAALRQIEMSSYCWQCVMNAYAEYRAEPGRRSGSFHWQCLADACLQLRIKRPIHGSQALADARATWQLIRACARLCPSIER